ncbi:hypothetical protein ALT_4734 [Aspergillus lentulus]|uniref:Uncharacterized protein n=1 Tax=Aspergillus lentulus TaxID=293939 RepID=A0AAN4PJR3_ASPLE|nr:uncharacterized protein IFM58399_02424 [Aspergillus lentulus]KAF4179862.1 hypothetical protein CNMCM7927_001579 [Aspergillus lentulus]KAF4200436.1 hypothetical protein CNMCM8927_003396 [Aspergillus lentulus]GAQ07413.1 hypothetical protein ALT_4734 [Aspergillus lentulus]GFF29938.1 hypothetical protein IFM58399_02424 [Aspergillus lentulus]GFF59018.1 hypothetical protein IFM62136_04015 [Aspergillus lentulus]
MNPLIRLLFVSLVASSAIAAPAPEQSEPVPVPKEDTFSENLNNINENSIHRALHLIERFRHGVFPTDRDAIDAIQREDRSLAAHLNLPRDIASNATTSSPNPPASTTQPPTTTTQETTSETTSTTESHTTTSTPSNPPPTTTETQPTTTTTTSETTTSTTQDTPAPTTATTTTSTTSSETRTTLTTASSTTEGQTTSKHTTTRTPYTSTYKSTTTLPNGQRSTVTAVTVVYPTGDSSNPGATGATTTGPAPGLQTGNAASITGLQKELLVMLGGAAAVAMAL